MTCVRGDPTDRVFEGLFHYLNAELPFTFQFQFVKLRYASQECYAATRDNTFFHRCLCGIQGILNAGFLFLHLCLGGSPNINDSNATYQLCKPFLKFLPVIVGSCFVNLCPYLSDPCFYILLVACTIHDCGIVFVNHHSLG
ncbi:MAG: hypothetical protein A4E58_02019 [Syntrophorhabdus sp. PtaB.Bin006]|nr:MAG: hypothetical protein A4E58_02019 [Syntrophorhabdus sp. PtaB.Bin006]